MKNKICESQEVVIQKLIDKYGDIFNFSKFKYVNRKTEVILICKNCGHEWESKPADLLRNRNIKHPCPKCFKLNRQQENANKFKEWFDKNCSDKFEMVDEYVSAKHLTTFKCKVCQTTFKQVPDGFKTSQYKCPNCAEIARQNSKASNTAQFIEKAKSVYGNRYDYSKTQYTRKNNPIIITCPKHGDFVTTPTSHIYKHSHCPQCQETIGEGHVRQVLIKLGYNFQSQQTIYINNKMFRIDFIVTHNNMQYYIEYNGKQHYEDVPFFSKHRSFDKQCERDDFIRTYCCNAQIPLLEIKYTSKPEDIEQQIIQFLNNELSNTSSHEDN